MTALIMRVSAIARFIAVLFFLEGVYLLVPWQSLAYGRSPFAGENLVIWMGASLMYLAGRAAWSGRLRVTWLALFAILPWVWLTIALTLNRDPHGFGPRNHLLLALIGWLPPLNTALSLVLVYVVATKKRIVDGKGPATPSRH
jgi:hypothetical protein